MSESNIKILLGKLPIVSKPVAPYSKNVLDFIADFGASLRSDKVAVSYPDIMSLAYWCRKSNLASLKAEYCDNNNRVGLGTVFHVTPSNVPVNFMFSFMFGLLSGNSNIVRLSSKEFPQTQYLIRHLSIVMEKTEYKDLKESNAFISYPRDNAVTRDFSLICNARIIWGGDATINEIRGCGLSPRAREITFADRYSLALIDAPSIMEFSENKMIELANCFYNDTYLMDQNACSSPHLILWSGANVEKAKEKFWNAVAEVTDKKYELQPINSVDKYTKTCCDAIANDFFSKITQFGNNVTTVSLTELPKSVDRLRGKCGYFLEYSLKDISELSEIVNEKYQTLCYAGIEPNQIKNLIIEKNLKGIDRIVPIGQSLNISVIWDGYDIINTLSRIISYV